MSAPNPEQIGLRVLELQGKIAALVKRYDEQVEIARAARDAALELEASRRALEKELLGFVAPASPDRDLFMLGLS